jgi:hypothetical protein
LQFCEQPFVFAKEKGLLQALKPILRPQGAGRSPQNKVSNISIITPISQSYKILLKLPIFFAKIFCFFIF